MTRLTLAALALSVAPVFAENNTRPDPEPPAVEQPQSPEPTPQAETRAEEDNWTCRDGLHRHENRTHLCVEKRTTKRSTLVIEDKYEEKW